MENNFENRLASWLGLISDSIKNAATPNLRDLAANEIDESLGDRLAGKRIFDFKRQVAIALRDEFVGEVAEGEDFIRVDLKGESYLLLVSKVR